MAKFINLSENRATLASYRDCNAQVCDLAELLDSLQANTNERLTCSIEGALDALCDGEFLSKTKANIDTVEYLFSVISETE